MATGSLATDIDGILRLLRSLPPRERLRVVAQILPELEDELPASLNDGGFWQGYSIERLAEQQGVLPIEDITSLMGGWPVDESVDDFLATMRQSRQDNPAQVSAE